MVIDPSLARGLCNRALRSRDKNLFNQLPTQVRGTRAAWLKQMHIYTKKHYGKYLLNFISEGTKPANTSYSYIVLNPSTSDTDDDLAFQLDRIEFCAKNQSIHWWGLPVFITRHAFERLVQSFGATNPDAAIEALIDPLMGVTYKLCKKDYHTNYTIHECSSFGTFLFVINEEGDAILRTVIKAEALEGAKRDNWEHKMQFPKRTILVSSSSPN